MFVCSFMSLIIWVDYTTLDNNNFNNSFFSFPGFQVQPTNSIVVVVYLQIQIPENQIY